jgi:hypothetical protein
MAREMTRVTAAPAGTGSRVISGCAPDAFAAVRAPGELDARELDPPRA